VILRKDLTHSKWALRVSLLLVKAVQRTLFNTVFSLLLTVSYLWGGCISCEQFFMWPGSKGHCCETLRCKKSTGKQSEKSNRQPTQQDCQMMPLDRSSGQRLLAAHSHHEATAAMAENHADSILTAETALLFAHSWIAARINPVDASPPDLPILYASLLI